MNKKKEYMKAVVWDGPFKLSLKEVEKPIPSRGEILIKTKAVGICGSDLEIFDGRFKQTIPPLVIGHEGGGVVQEIGQGVKKVKERDRIIAE